MLRSRIAFLLALAITGAAYAATDTAIHRTFNVAPGGTLTLDADVGDIQVTSGGSALVEKLSPGTPHEMVSVYHDKDGELAMTFRMSAVAVCRSSASWVSLNSRAFSMAMTAWSAKVSTS